MIDIGQALSAIAFSISFVLGIFLMAVYFSGQRSDKINKRVQALLDDMPDREDND